MHPHRRSSPCLQVSESPHLRCGPVTSRHMKRMGGGGRWGGICLGVRSSKGVLRAAFAHESTNETQRILTTTVTALPSHPGALSGRRRWRRRMLRRLGVCCARSTGSSNKPSSQHRPAVPRVLWPSHAPAVERTRFAGHTRPTDHRVTVTSRRAFWRAAIAC